MRLKPLARQLRRLALVLLAAELVYVVAANLLLVSGLIPLAVSMKPEEAVLDFGRAWSPWPGRVYVSDLHLRVQDPILQFRLTVAQAEVDVVLLSLLHREFRASHVRASGVSYRFLTRVGPADAASARVEAFPPLEGLDRPPLSPDPMPPLPTGARLDAIWSVRLDEVFAAVDELWFLEYRYQGPAQVTGGFLLSPLRKLQVGPAVLTLGGGALSAGEHPISGALRGSLEVTIDPVDLQARPELGFLESLTATVRLQVPLDDLGVAELYRPGLRLTGHGDLELLVAVAGGRVLPSTAAKLRLPALEGALGGYQVAGDAQAELTMTEDGGVPEVSLAAAGTATGAAAGSGPVTAVVSGLSARVVLAGNELAQGLALDRLSVVVGEARVADARGLTHLVAKQVPLIAEAVLGEGPLVGSATAYVTPAYTLVRLKRLTLGAAALEGAAVPGAEGWSGAVAGHFGAIQLGLRMRKGKLESVVFAPPRWLDAELAQAGIRPD